MHKDEKIIECILTLTFIGIVVIFISLVVFDIVQESKTTKEQIEQEQIAQEEYEFNHTYHFPVISVFRYLKTETTKFGDVIDQEVRYSFIWLDADGNTHQTDDYIHIDIGSVDEFVVRDYSGGWTNLFLTEETIKSLNQK